LAGVNHKKIKQLIAQKRKTINDRQFFKSRILAGHFEDMAVAQTRRYGYNRKIKVRIVWEPKNGSLACTQNEFIWINAGHPFVTKKKGRQERYDMVCGLFAHELGHVLYTDFLASQNHVNYVLTDRWYPESPFLKTRDERMNETDIWDYAKSDPKHKAALLELTHNLNNILEDGYVDSKVMNRYPGVLGQNLRFLSETQFELDPTLTEKIEREDEPGGHIWLTITSLILSYVLWGEMKYGDEPHSDERVQTVFALIPELDTAITDSSAKERWNITNIILIRCWKYVKDFLEYCEELSETATVSGGSASAGDIVSQLMSALAGTSAEGEGTSIPVTEAAGASSSPAAAGKRAKTKQLAATASNPSESEDENDDESESGANAAGENKSEDEKEEKSGSGDSAADENESEDAGSGSSQEAKGFDDGSASGSPHQNVSSEEQGRIPLEETDKLSEPTSGEFERDDEYTGTGYTGSASDIERLLENMAENAVNSQLEKERTAELNELANSVSYGNIHSGVNMVVHRMAEVSDGHKEKFDEISAELIHISKLLQKSITQQLQDKRRGGKQTSLLMGRRLDAHALPRNDGRVFYKNSLPNEVPELALALLNDESTSMCSCDRVTYARASAIILYDFCRALGIPIMVYGHSTGHNCVDLYSYAEFDAIDRDDRYRMMDISGRGSNRDGAALRYVAEQLLKRAEDIKILMLISDGQPADFGYSGTAAEEDLRGIKQEYAKKGIIFVAAAIGNDKANIQRIYGDSFLDITDLTKLPIQLANVVKRHIRV